ncbi:pentapeptide repeat-containing protein [uncultured Nostoc sp.]|uniref:pentapeptide repeat-containing protein n=1 Tax=uncultured Nostoc sp. TaxID=340711 RepID=UPI0035CBFCCC
MPQDFSGQNLRGRSFKGQNLEGANFRYADIRSADFTGANLRGANFSHAKAGLQRRWVITLLVLALLLGLFSGFLSGQCAWLLNDLFKLVIYFLAYFVFHVHIPLEYTTEIKHFSDISLDVYISFFQMIFFCLLLIIGLREGIREALEKSILIGVFFIALMAVWLTVFSSYYNIIGYVSGWFKTIVWFACIMLFAPIAVATSKNLAGVWAGRLTICLAVTISISNGFDFVFNQYGGGNRNDVGNEYDFAVISIGILAGILMFLSGYIAKRAFTSNTKYVLVRQFTIFISAIGGTSFRNADLTDANFTEGTLKSTDFTKANLTRTCFHKTKKLDLVRPGTTYLQKTQLVSVLATLQGLDLNFDREDLRGVNFQGANLVDASFIGADLSQANLQDADLSRAKLVQAQLNGTDLTGATLTGTYIQDWGITTDTKFDGVRCEYVYMRLPTKENPDPLRKPDNNKEVFADGEFGDFIKPIFDTLDLYHNQGIDPRAIAISFKELAENHPDAELEIVAMEKRGQDKFLLRAKTTVTADKSELSKEYFDTYNQLKSLAEQEVQKLIAEKDNIITDLKNMVVTALYRPSVYSNTQIQEVGTMTNNPGGFSVGGSVGGNVNNVQGDNNRAVQGDNNQAVLGDNNEVTQQNQVGADTGESLTKEDVIKLLAQLETLIQGAELPADTKEEVIEDLSAAKKATDKEEPNKQRALERLGTVAETLEKTSKGVEAGQKVWTTAKPIIVKVATWLGVAAGSHLLGL